MNIITPDDYQEYTVDNQKYFKLNGLFGSTGEKIYRDVPLNADKNPGYFLKEFLKDVFDINTTNLNIEVLRQIFNERVEGSFRNN